MHVIVLICSLESITVSWLSHACHAHCFAPAYAKFAHEFLTLFHWPCATDSTALIRFIAFSHKLHSTAFTCLPSYTKLQAHLLYTAGIPLLEACLLPMANNRTRNERLSQEQTAFSHVVQIHTHARFPRNKKWLTYPYAVPAGNPLALQRSIFRENCSKFSTFIRCGEG